MSATNGAWAVCVGCLAAMTVLLGIARVRAAPLRVHVVAAAVAVVLPGALILLVAHPAVAPPMGAGT